MKVIYKYKTDSANSNSLYFRLTLYVGAEVLTVQRQGLDTYFWILHDTKETKLQERNFKKIGTGQVFEGNCKYIGTVQELSGALIWHYFEVL